MGLSVGIFGTFYPEFNYAGNSTTPIALGLAEVDFVDRVTVFCQEGAHLPQGFQHNDVELVPCWRHESATSLSAAVRQTLAPNRQLDVLLFNTFVTAYGRSRLANATGLALPNIIAKLSRRPTVVYMHNFVETQEIEKLGYSPSWLGRLAVKQLEQLLLKNTRVIVPLASQAGIIEARLGRRPLNFLFPFLESHYLLRHPESIPSDLSARTSQSPFRILLMGTWGPQKDLIGAIEALRRLSHEGLEIETTIVGGSNVHFPDMSVGRVVEKSGGQLRNVRLTGPLNDSDLLRAVWNHDLLVLPYNSTGGYSGAMNFAAVTGIPIVAYEAQQLREHAALLGVDVTFVPRKELAQGIRSVLTRLEQSRGLDRILISQRIASADDAILHFAEILRTEVQSCATQLL